MANKIIEYFDLRSSNKTGVAAAHAAESSLADVLPQYVAVSAGVIIEPFLRKYIETDSWQLWPGIWGRIVFGLIIGIIILPSVYKSSFDPDKPIFVQLAALVPLGIGWQSLFSTATQVVS